MASVTLETVKTGPHESEVIIVGELLDASNELAENTIQDNPLLTVTDALVGPVRVVTLHYPEFKVNLEGEYFTIPAGSIDINDADVLSPTLYYVYIELVADNPVVKVSTTNPHVPGVECEYAFLSTVLMRSIAGVAELYYARRAYNSNYNEMHHIGDYDIFLEPKWVTGMGISINPATGEVSVAAGYAVRLTRDLTYPVAANTPILLDDETVVNNLESITTYSNGNAITGGKYHKLLVGAVVSRAGSDYKVRVLRMDEPTVEYSTLDEARIDSERRAQVSFGESWRANIIPIYYIYMKNGDASDLDTVDIRESGVTGGGGGGSITVEKIVFVDNTGAGDFLTIRDALRSVPNARGMIISLMGGQFHDVSSVEDARGVMFQFGGGPGRAIIRAQPGGSLIIGGTTFTGINIQVPLAFLGTYFLDAQEELSDFVAILFQPAAGRSVIGCSIAASPFIGAFRLCGQNVLGGYTGDMIDAASPWLTVLPIILGTINNVSPMQLGAFDVSCDPFGLFTTTGAVTVNPVTTDFDVGAHDIINVGNVDGVDVSAIGALAHARAHAITSAPDHTSAATPGQILQADANGLPVDATNTDAEVSAAVTASHVRAHAITSAPDHTSAATPGQILQADANGLPVDATNTDAEVSAAVTASHAESHAITSATDHTSTATAGQMLKADANGLPVNALNTDGQVSAAVTASHARAHQINAATDHTSTATAGQILKADANGLPVDATNSDAAVSAAVTASHARAHAMDSGTDHSAGTQGDILYAGAAGAWARLGVGTSGQKLTTNGAAANPSWKTGQSQTIDFSQGSDTIGAGSTLYYKANALDSGLDECEKPVVLTDSPVIKTLVVNVTTNTRPNNTTFTVMVNGVASALALVVPGGGTGAYSATANIAIVLGDKIAVRIVTGATAGTLSRSCAAVLITN